ncbi:glycoside hydrolase [Xylariaceae sp. FL0255]|nr:glycoside hydrolase [Xylariaceae sp. FL0255]
MVRTVSLAAALAAWATVGSAAPSSYKSNCVTIQHDFNGSQALGNPVRAAAVKAEYVYVWEQYMAQAFPQDELLALNHTGEDVLFGWGASIIDGLDTAILMGLHDIVNTQLNFIYNFKFNHSVNGPVDHFDAIIRYLGGLLSAHDILNSNLVPNGTYEQKYVDALLSQAVVIADGLKPGFNTPSGIPVAYYNYTTGAVSNCYDFDPNCNSTTVSTSQVTTIILEFFHLSDLTGDTSYRELAARCEANFLNTQDTLRYPYLWGTEADYVTGKVITNDVGWQANIDSGYEYLIKTYVYDPTRADEISYKNYWTGVVNSTIDILISHPYHRPELTFISEADVNGTLIYSMDDYSCFAGGNILLGGQYLGNSEYLDLGFAYTDSCHDLLNTSAAGLNPSQVTWFNSSNQLYDPSEDTPENVAYADTHGYFVTDPYWDTYPEPLESIFYAYRISGDQTWADYNWAAFEAMVRDTHQQAGVSFASLSNVTEPLGGPLDGPVEAFLFAEVLKYLYLTFAPSDIISLDEWVFNTEGHPFKIQTGTCATS